MQNLDTSAAASTVNYCELLRHSPICEHHLLGTDMLHLGAAIDMETYDNGNTRAIFGEDHKGLHMAVSQSFARRGEPSNQGVETRALFQFSQPGRDSYLYPVLPAPTSSTILCTMLPQFFDPPRFVQMVTPCLCQLRMYRLPGDLVILTKLPCRRPYTRPLSPRHC